MAGAKRYNREQQALMVEDFQASGMPVDAYCADRGISPQTLKRWMADATEKPAKAETNGGNGAAPEKTQEKLKRDPRDPRVERTGSLNSVTFEPGDGGSVTLSWSGNSRGVAELVAKFLTSL